MPIEDMEDVRCPFCRHYLTDLDGLLECMVCGATNWEDSGWELSECPMVSSPLSEHIYNSAGRIVKTNTFPLSS